MTDIVIFYLPQDRGLVPNDDSYDFGRSVLYAFIGSASCTLGICDREISGVFHYDHGNGSINLVIYDQVPDGAGYAGKIAEELMIIIHGMHEVVSGLAVVAKRPIATVA